MTAYEVIRDPTTGEALASVCVTAPLTDDERAVLVEYFQWRQHARGGCDGACAMCDDNACGTRESG